MDITSYCEKTKHKVIHLCKLSIGRDYKILNADEFFYSFIGTHEELPFSSLIHPDDFVEFCNAADKLKNGEQHLLIRVKNPADVYRYYKITIALNGRIIEGFASYDMTIMDIQSTEIRYTSLDFNVRKYRRYMSIINNFYFEYELETNIFKIFIYVDEKSNLIVNEDFDVFSKMMLEKYLPDERSKNHFITFQSYLKDGVDNFQIQFEATFLSKSERKDNLLFKGGTYYYGNKKELVMGVMTSTKHWINEKAYYLTEAANDCATGLFNKRATMEYASDRIRSLDPNKAGLALVIIDIDNFKNINDSFGHLFGDEVILKVADVIKCVVGARGVVGRFGGDEFMIVLEKFNSKQAIETMLGTIARHMSWIYKGISDDIHLTASIGVSMYPEDGNTYEELFMKADKALYITKENGKDGYVIYDEKLHADIDIMNGSDTYKHKIETNWCDMISASVIELHKYGRSSIPGIIQRLCENSELSGIIIYAGNELKRTYTEGSYKFLLDSFWDFAYPDYFNDFKQNNTFVINNAEKLESGKYGLYEECNRQDIKAFLQCATYKDGKPYVLVTFDIRSHTYNWTVEEVDALVVIAKMIGQILVERAKN